MKSNTINLIDENTTPSMIVGIFEMGLSCRLSGEQRCLAEGTIQALKNDNEYVTVLDCVNSFLKQPTLREFGSSVSNTFLGEKIYFKGGL